MAYVYQGVWTLYSNDVKLKRGPKVTTYFFSKYPIRTKKKPKSGKPSEMPNGFRVIVNKRTGLPLLKKK